MEYPKAIMRVKELEEMGYPREYLFRAYYSRNQDFAWKQNPMKSNSPVLFDTEKFEKWRLKDIQIQGKSRERRYTVA